MGNKPSATVKFHFPKQNKNTFVTPVSKVDCACVFTSNLELATLKKGAGMKRVILSKV